VITASALSGEAGVPVEQPIAQQSGAEGARSAQVKLLGKIAFASTALFAAQLYLAPAQWIPELDPLHLALVFSLLGIGAICLRRLLTNQPLQMGWRTAFLAVYCADAVLSPIWTIEPIATRHGAIEVAKHFLFFLTVVNSVTTPGRIRTALLLYAGAATIPGWGTFWNYLHDLVLVEGFRGRWLGVMADPNHDAMALVGAIPILLFFVVSGKGFLRRVVGLVGVAACFAGVVATHSRGGSVGLAVALVVWAMMSKRKALATVAVLFSASAVLLFAPRTFWERNETIAGYAEDVSVQGRLQAWQVAFRIAKERPLVGVGEAAFLEAWTQYAPMDSGVLGGHRFVAHNLFLEVLGELGLVGLFGMVGFIACALWSAWRARNGELGGESRAVFAALVGYLVCQQFSGYSLSWFLYSLCAFATCIDLYSPKSAKKIEQKWAVLGPDLQTAAAP